MSLLGNRQQVESYKTEAVPQSLQGNDSPASIRGKVRQVSVPSINGDQKSNGKLRFILPNNNASISRRSMFIRARCSLAYTGALPGLNNINSCIWFQGPGNTNQTVLSGSANNADQTTNVTLALPSLSNAYSLIQRSTIYSGSVVVDMIDYVCDLMSGLILPHATNINWISTDGQALLAIASPPMKSTTLTTGGFLYWDLAIPVPHACFNTQHDFPAYLLSESNPLSLEIDLTTFNRAMNYVGGGSLPSDRDYTLSRVALCYEEVELPREYIEAQRLATKNTPFVIPQLSYMISQMPMGSMANYNCVLKMSSLRAAYILPSNSTSYTALYPSNSTAFAYTRRAVDVNVATASGVYEGTNAQLFIDSKCINQVNLDNPCMTFVALKQALKGSITDYTSSSICNLPIYKASFFAIGIDTTAFSDGSTLMGGTPVNEAQIVLTNFVRSGQDTYLANVIFAYDSLIIIKNGKITTKR
jgi:hypothetical protein